MGISAHPSRQGHLGATRVSANSPADGGPRNSLAACARVRTHPRLRNALSSPSVRRGGMRTIWFGNIVVVRVTGSRSVREAVHEAPRGTEVAGLVGLIARGILYLVLAVLALGLVFGRRQGNEVDARGAMEELARHGFGAALLVILAIGFAGFASWYAYEALTGHDTRRDGSDRFADGARAVVYGVLCVLALSFL